MAALFQIVLMRVALCGLAVSLGVLVFHSEFVRGLAAELLEKWKRLTALGRAVVCSFLLVGFLVADKTNGVNNLPPQQMVPPMAQQGNGFALTGLPVNGNLTNAMNFVQPQATCSERKSANWNIRGAWRDSFGLDFEDGWVFPWGTNHLSGVEVVSYGQVWPTPFDTNAVASVGVPVEIVPGLTTFAYEFTPSNSYRFAWTDAAVNRDTNNLITAALELFRNGDIAVTTNGVVSVLPRTLPFPHSGIGQDDEWVVANFTNAVEIAAAGGYAAWVDAQVGTGLTNGLYKLVVTVAEDPPETTLVTVGDLSVAVTNAGEYAFLLCKGARYGLSASSDCATNFLYSAVDDVAAPIRMNESLCNLLGEGGEDGVWSSSSDELRLFAPFGFVVWHPMLSISPRKWHPSRANATRAFTATLSDLPPTVSPSYAWSTADANVCSCADATSRTATYACHFPAADGSGVSLGLDVALDGTTLHADYWYYVGCISEVYDYEEPTGDDNGDYDPVPCLVVGASPSVVFFEAGTSNAEWADVGCYYLVDEAGTFELSLSGDAVSVMDQGGAAVSSGYTWSTSGGVVGARHFLVESPVKSSSPSGTVLTVTFTPGEGTNTMSDAASVTFVEWKTETTATWPNDRTRKTIGVCEAVNITMDPYMQNYEPNKTSVDSSLQKRNNGRWLYRAPGIQAVDEIFVPGHGNLFSFDVIAPVGYEANLKTIVVATNCPPSMAGGYVMLFDLVVLPTNVSFYAIRIKEVGMTSTNAVGYFAEPRNAHFLTHTAAAGAGTWSVVYKGNKCSDSAQMAELSPPWGNGGSMTWPIPNEYTGNPSNSFGTYFCNTDQSFSVDSEGTAREEKFGWFAEATTNRVISYGRTQMP